MTTLFTIGFTRKTAAHFFYLLREAGVQRLLDVRLNNASQLAGFAKREDLRFFCREIAGIEYAELRELAPEPAMLKAYQRKDLDWAGYDALYRTLLAERAVEASLDPALFDRGCLLCSEHQPHHCHRRVAADYLNRAWGGRLVVRHLV